MPEKDALIDFFENEDKYIDEIAAKQILSFVKANADDIEWD